MFKAEGFWVIGCSRSWYCCLHSHAQASLFRSIVLWEFRPSSGWPALGPAFDFPIVVTLCLQL